MKIINQFFNKLRLNAGAIWLENNTINLSVPKNFQNQETKDFIVNNKNQIISILNENQIFSAEKFLSLKILKDNSITFYPLSPSQERLWFIEQYEKGINAFRIPTLYELNVNTDTEVLKYALQQIVSRHEVLRSTIALGENQEHYMVVHNKPLNIEEKVITNIEDIQSIIKEDINHPFDLSSEYPIRIKFYTVQPEKYAVETSLKKTLLLVNIHQIAGDEWSIDIFQKELFAYYEAYINKEVDFCLPALEIQYKDYAVWLRTYLTGEVLERQLNYWKSKLLGYQNLELPTDYARPNVIDNRGSTEIFVLDKVISQKLRALTQRHGASLHSVMLSSINILLSKYTGQDDIVVGSPIANRHHIQTEGLIGFFSNIQVNRVLLNNSQSYEELIRQIHQEQVEAQLYQDLPIDNLIVELGVERDTSRNRIFQVYFAIQSFSNRVKNSEQQWKYLRPFQEKSLYEIEKFDLSITIDDSCEELTGQVSYAISLFQRDTILRLIHHYIHLLDLLTKAPAKPYSHHSLLNPEEYNQIVCQWNETFQDYPQDRTIYQLFQEQVERTSGNIAVVYEQQRLTYKELNEKSNQLANYIRVQFQNRTGRSLIGGTLIALYLDRGLEAIVGMLAVMKAGGAYVPMDINYPQDRVDYILGDTQAELILSQRHLTQESQNILPEGKVINIDLIEDIYEKEDKSNLQQHSKSTDLIYVIYTSGTTGRPKGVELTHRGVTNLVFTQKGELGISSESRVLQYASLVFDASVNEIFSALTFGAELLIVSNTVRQDASLLSEYLEVNRINIAIIPPVLLSAMPYKELSNLRSLIVAGESCPLELMIKWSQGRRLINAYGPTENSVCATMHTYEKGDLNTNIGKPINNVKVFVLDSNLAPVPVGIVGELYIGGAGLARGYLKRPDLTEERFVTNPFVTDSDRANGYTRMYKTGDLVKWLPDGNLVFIGRNDDQVKVRGYRIELSEIEHALMKIQGIKQCCVLIRDRKIGASSNKYLAAYYIPGIGVDLSTPEDILDQLSQVLPAYMVPGVLMPMESFPLTINGKLDKHAFPDSDFSLLKSEYVAPASEREKTICNIWQEILGLEQVGVTDDFFKIGGNSILAVYISHRMGEALRCDVKVADVFKYKTISQLLPHYIKGLTQTRVPKIDSDRAVLSFAQERLWFIEQYEGGTNAYHIPAVFEIDDTADVEGVKYALRQIVNRHEVLRSTIEQNDNQEHGIQIAHDSPLAIAEVMLTNTDDYESYLKEEINRPFDLSAEYPIRVKIFTIQQLPGSSGMPLNRRVLLVNIHHIAGDGWSIDIFLRELFAYYEAYINKDSNFQLPELDIQYKDYAVWQRSYLTGKTLEEQIGYWKAKLFDYQTLELPADFVRPNEIDYRGSSQTVTLNGAVSQRLRELAKRHGATLHSVMLSSASILLSKYTGQNDIVIGCPIANRHHQQTEGLIGFFVNTQASRIILGNTQNYVELIQQVHQDQIEAQLYQDLPFEKLVEELGVVRDLSRHPVFQVMFSVQNFGRQIKSQEQQKEYLRPSPSKGAYEVEKFDLSIFVNDAKEELTVYISYATSLFREDTMAHFIAHYAYLLTQLTESPEKPYSQISLLDPKEYKKIVYQWNETGNDFPKDKTIHQLFQEQVSRVPEEVALVYKQQKLTYKELNEKSNQLARHIRAQYQQRTNLSLTTDTPIALFLDRNLEMLIGVLAVLKAGGTYVPIDITYPQDRVDYILMDTQAEIVLGQKYINIENQTQLPHERVVFIDLDEKLYKEEDSSNLSLNGSGKDLAYIIYTSGTTGKPKGVMIEHGAILSLVYNDYVHVSRNDVFAFLSSPTFDAATFEIWTPLLKGNQLVIPSDVKNLASDTKKFSEFLSTNKISILWLTKTLFESLYYLDSSLFQNLHYLIIGGEALDRHTVNKLVESNTKPNNFLNGYGPTESTTFTCTYNLKNLIEGYNVPIGKPINNRSTYILDQNNLPVPVGVIGELYIGGAGLARGYLKNHELTEERFIPNPFATDSDRENGYTRLYRTGDLVRWLPDGNIEFIGRNDDQVKIRGYRIELGEIEYALTQISGIKQGCVLVKERKTDSGSSKYLVAYCVQDNSENLLTHETILGSLSHLLPEYMIPNALVEMKSFPLTINGKLDKSALPDPVFSSSTCEYAAPTTEPEVELCRIWQKVLGVDRVGITDDFFRLGGNSILAIQVSHRMSISLGCDVKVADVFKLKTISRLMENIILLQDDYENVELEY